MSRLLSPEQVAEQCGLSRRAIYRAIERGELPASKLCGRLRIRSESVDEWIDGCRVDGEPWAPDAYKSWARKRPRGRKRNDERTGSAGPFARAATAAGVPDATPYTLRHSFCSLLLHEGRSVVYVAKQLGHGAQLTLGKYGHVIDELEDAPRVSAEDVIRAARAARVSGLCPSDAQASGA